jgi:hemolysin activation/secretion protein
MASAAHAGDSPLSPTDPTRALPTPAPAGSPLDVRPAPTPALPPDTTARLVLQGVKFDGAITVPEASLRPAWWDLVGKPVTLSDLRNIGHRAEKIYADAGYPFVAVVLRVQQVTDGVVHYDVVEGRVSDLSVLGSNATARRQATAALSPLVNHVPLSLADVEAAYENAKAVPGLSVSGTLRRGSEPGGMNLVVDAQRDAWRTYANINDLYADAVGPWGMLAGVDYFGESNYGDETSLQVYTSLPTGRQTVIRGSHSRRLNESGTTINFTGLWGDANPQGSDLTPLAIAQDVVQLRFDVAQPIIEQPDTSFQLDLALEGNNQKTNVFTRTGLSNDKLRDLSLSFTGEKRGSAGRIAFTGEWHQGLSIFNASEPGDPSLSRSILGANPQATILRGGVEIETVSYANIIRLDERLDAQYSPNTLAIPDQYSPGNLTIGRGYQPGSALGDSAVAVSTEVRFGPFDVWRKVQAEPFIFNDVVDMWNTSGVPFHYRTLVSYGGGFRFQLNGKAHLDLLCAVPAVAPLPGQPTPKASFLMNLTVSLDDAFAAIHNKLVSGSAK